MQSRKQIWEAWKPRFRKLFEKCRDLTKKYYAITKKYLLSETFLFHLSYAPLFFTWIVPLTFRYENLEFRKASFYGVAISTIFFLLLAASWIVSSIPFVGNFFGNLIHFVGIIAYLGFSAFFLYTHTKHKNLDLPFLTAFSNKLFEFSQGSAAIAQLDRVPDYGSGGSRFKSS